MLSPDQEFSGDGIGAISSIPYHTVFRAVKRFFIVKWTHERIKAIVGQINGYVFDNVAQMEEDDTSGQPEDMVDRVMAALDDSDSSSDEDPIGSDSLRAHHPTVVEPSSLTTASSGSNTVAVASPLQHEPPSPSDVAPSISTQGAVLNPGSSATSSESGLAATVIAAPHLEPAIENSVAVTTKSNKGRRGKNQKAELTGQDVRRSSRHTVSTK
jgi:hypothetical protein